LLGQNNNQAGKPAEKGNMTKQEAEAAVRKYGSMRAAAKGLRVARKTIRKAISGAITATPLKAAASTSGKSLADFKQTYDKSFIIPQKVRAALKALGAGWEYEVAFAKLAGVSLVDLGIVRDEFAGHVVTIGRDSKRAWAGTKATAEAMRKML
jgi:hypothetical protein